MNKAKEYTLDINKNYNLEDKDNLLDVETLYRLFFIPEYTLKVKLVNSTKEIDTFDVSILSSDKSLYLRSNTSIMLITESVVNYYNVVRNWVKVSIKNIDLITDFNYLVNIYLNDKNEVWFKDFNHEILKILRLTKTCGSLECPSIVQQKEEIMHYLLTTTWVVTYERFKDKNGNILYISLNERNNNVSLQKNNIKNGSISISSLYKKDGNKIMCNGNLIYESVDPIEKQLVFTVCDKNEDILTRFYLGLPNIDNFYTEP